MKDKTLKSAPSPQKSFDFRLTASNQADAPETDAPVAEGENPPLSDPLLPHTHATHSHGSDTLDAHIADKLAKSPEACAKHVEQGLRALREDPSETNRLALRRRLREVARAWGIPVSGRD